MKADAVFEGGGVKGIGLVGALCCFEDNGYQWQNIAGTSAGAIIAAMLAVGYTGQEMKKIIYNLNYENLLDKNWKHYIPVLGKGLDFLIEKGLYRGKEFEKWITEILQAKGKIKFKDVSKDGQCRLKIIATDITKGDMIIFPDDLKKYGLDPMEFEIAKAVRMSIGIPFFFIPYKLKYKNQTSYIVDGGVLSNFPVWIFDVEGAPRWPTFGFRFMDEYESKTGSGKTNIIAYTMDLMETLLDKNETRYIKSKDKVRTIQVPSVGVKTTEFDISKDKCNLLFKSGYAAAQKFFLQWDFEDYVQAYRL
ncbi:patatin-like phospholipase family protein [Bacillota bacterium LX-D]|nr:patatin-like phospholipase family protein [Bacillota bacterium LX-D]